MNAITEALPQREEVFFFLFAVSGKIRQAKPPETAREAQGIFLEIFMQIRL